MPPQSLEQWTNDPGALSRGENRTVARELLEVALGRAGLDAQDVLVVGDSVWDMEAAVRVGATAVGVATGGTSAPELEGAGADVTFPDLETLLHDLQVAGSGVRSG